MEVEVADIVRVGALQVGEKASPLKIVLDVLAVAKVVAEDKAPWSKIEINLFEMYSLVVA
jgi:hypothetical protein